jgi:hypothetical protein
MSQETENTEKNEKQRPPWRKPAITRIELKRTLFELGSDIDGQSGTFFPPPI